mmetsp:Transcript_19882/g.39802  ORF Transcript_19882/g.39802 Transcript_19882/m.39802 type:complete len:251 (-) Transcript_19882:919-1671(-)
MSLKNCSKTCSRSDVTFSLGRVVARQCRLWLRVLRTFECLLPHSCSKQSLSISQPPSDLFTALTTAGKEKAQEKCSSWSVSASADTEDISMNRSMRALGMGSSPPVRLEMNLPSSHKAACLTNLEESSSSAWKCATREVLVLCGSTFETETMDSAQAFRTLYMSSLVRRMYAGRSLPLVSSSPATLHMLAMLRAACFLTLKTGSSARLTTSGTTNCLHKSWPTPFAIFPRSPHPVIRSSSFSSLWLRVRI